MKKKLFGMASLLLMVLMLSSCVAKRKYLSAKNNEAQMRAQNAKLANTLSMQADSITRLRAEIVELEQNVSALGDVYRSTNNQLNMSKDEIAAQQRRLVQLQNLIGEQKKLTEDLRKKVADALVNFNTNELTISIKNGKVYVSMQESLLFPSGSAVVNKRGKEALAKVAYVLNSSPDINVNVEGHTDTVPIHTKQYGDNWVLSVARANSITHVLIEEYGVTPGRLIASGRSQYQPVANNETNEGRALNRRTEIILEPKLDKLMDLLYTAPSTTGLMR